MCKYTWVPFQVFLWFAQSILQQSKWFISCTHFHFHFHLLTLPFILSESAIQCASLLLPKKAMDMNVLLVTNLISKCVVNYTWRKASSDWKKPWMLKRLSSLHLIPHLLYFSFQHLKKAFVVQMNHVVNQMLGI